MVGSYGRLTSTRKKLRADWPGVWSGPLVMLLSSKRKFCTEPSPLRVWRRCHEARSRVAQTLLCDDD